MTEEQANLFSQIEQNYNIKIANYRIPQRGYVAETFVLTDTKGQEYFAKITDKPLFQKQIIESLPVLDSMHKSGVEKICYPIPANSGLYCEFKDYLIVLFNNINAQQSYNYPMRSFGKLLGSIHASTAKVATLPKKETFDFSSARQTYANFKSILLQDTDDEFVNKFIAVGEAYEDDVSDYFSCFSKLSKRCAAHKASFDYVITHNDAGGNVLVKSPDDLYLIDWDSIMLAPAERDTWPVIKYSGFIKGYQSENPSYEVDWDLQKYYTFRYFFDNLNYVTADIVRTDLSPASRQRIIDFYTKGTIAKGEWLYPYLQSALKENQR